MHQYIRYVIFGRNIVRFKITAFHSLIRHRGHHEVFHIRSSRKCLSFWSTWLQL